MSYLDGAISREAYNERVKLVSHTLQNFGVALTVGLVANLFAVGVNPTLIYGSVIAIFMFAAAYAALGNIEGANDDK